MTDEEQEVRIKELLYERHTISKKLANLVSRCREARLSLGEMLAMLSKPPPHINLSLARDRFDKFTSKNSDFDVTTLLRDTLEMAERHELLRKDLNACNGILD